MRDLDVASIMEREKRVHALAEKYMDDGVAFAPAIVRAGDEVSRQDVEAAVAAGKMSPLQGMVFVGSFARFDYALRLLPTKAFQQRIVELWRGADPDDTDPRFLAAWERAVDDSGKAYLRDGKPLPRGQVLEVWRGQKEGDPFGIAWTTDYGIAKAFSEGMGNRAPLHGGVVYAGRVARMDVLAYITGRGESEVVVNPERVHQKRVVHRG
jgi:hypothetical protein